MISIIFNVILLILGLMLLSPVFLVFVEIMRYMESKSRPVPVYETEPQVAVERRPRSKSNSLHTVPSSSSSNPAIKEFTLPDGSKVAVDCGKVSIEEKKVIE